MLYKEKEEVVAKVNEIRSMQELSSELERTTDKVRWALTIRENQHEVEQARLFYEAYRIMIGKESILK